MFSAVSSSRFLGAARHWSRAAVSFIMPNEDHKRPARQTNDGNVLVSCLPNQFCAPELLPEFRAYSNSNAIIVITISAAVAAACMEQRATHAGLNASDLSPWITAPARASSDQIRSPSPEQNPHTSLSPPPSSGLGCIDFCQRSAARPLVALVVTSHKCVVIPTRQWPWLRFSLPKQASQPSEEE